MMSVGLHLRIMAQPGRSWAFETFPNHVRANDDMWAAADDEVAQA